MDKRKNEKTQGSTSNPRSQPKPSEGYPPYPPEEDIYQQGEAFEDADPEPSGPSRPPRPDEPNEVDDVQSRMGDDLDVPGGELDDADESIGEEDEENNYYSLEDQDDEIPPQD